MNYMSKARQQWQMCNVLRAIRLYQKVINQNNSNTLEKNMAMYMLAYLFIQQAKATNNEMGVLGVDLSQPYQDYYYQAALCHRKITDPTFDAEILDLPCITEHDQKLMQDAYQERCYINRCAREYQPHAWHADALVWLQQCFYGLLKARTFALKCSSPS